MGDKPYNAILSSANPYFYLKVKEGQTETGNRESYYGKIPQDDRCTFDISNNKILINMEQFGKIKAANFYRGCYLTDDIPGVWMHKDFSSVSLFYEIFINGHKQIPEEATEYIMDFVDNIFPRTVLSFEDIKVSVVSYAPVSENGNERSNALYMEYALKISVQDRSMGQPVFLRKLLRKRNCLETKSVFCRGVEEKNQSLP